MFGLDLAETQTIMGVFGLFILLFMAIQIGINMSKAGKWERQWQIDQIEDKADNAVNECKKYTDTRVDRTLNDIWDIRKNLTLLNTRMEKVEGFQTEFLAAVQPRDMEFDPNAPAKTTPLTLRADQV